MMKWIVLFCFSLAAYAQQRGVNFYSIEKEQALGKQLAEEIQRQYPALNQPAAREYVERIGRRLEAQLDAAPFPYTYAVVTDPAAESWLEPIALPGGYVFVPASLLLSVRNESELAAVLAHSVFHVAARHGTRQQTRGEIANLASVPLVFMGTWTGYGVRQAAAGSTAIPMGLLSFQRSFETDTDLAAVKLLAAAGYDPEALAAFIERVQIDSTPAFSSVPSRAQRVTAIRAAIAELPPPALDAIQQLVRDAAAGNN
jgi:predicted Zn-dependent protease